MQQDPFFAARAKMQGFGQGGRSYLEDINRTYNKLPARDNSTFERAMQFRQREKAQLEAIAQENNDLRRSLAQYETIASQATSMLKSQSESINSLKSKLSYKTDGGSASRSISSVGGNGVSPFQEPNTRPRGGVPLRMQHEVLPTHVPDSRGQGDQHTDEGRQASDDRGPSTVEVRERSV